MHRNNIERPDYITPIQLSERMEALTLTQIRWLLSHREKNGLNQYVRKVGRRVFVSESGFYKWFDEQKG